VPGFIGANEEVGAALALAAEADTFEEGIEFGKVAGADFDGAGTEAGAGFQAAELDRIAKGKLDFVGVENVEDHDFVTRNAELVNAAEDGFLVVEEIADEHDDAAPARLASKSSEGAGNGGFFRGDRGSEEGADFVNFAEAVRARETSAKSRIEDRDLHGVTLEENEVSKARGDGARVVQLGPVARSISHRFARIDEEVRDEVRLLLVLLDDVTIGAPEYFPVEMTSVVAGNVLAVLGKLDRETPVGRPVRPSHVAFDDLAGLHAELLGALDRCGIKKWAEGHLTFG